MDFFISLIKRIYLQLLGPKFGEKCIWVISLIYILNLKGFNKNLEESNIVFPFNF